jgi:hypothetical protein
MARLARFIIPIIPPGASEGLGGRVITCDPNPPLIVIGGGPVVSGGGFISVGFGSTPPGLGNGLGLDALSQRSNAAGKRKGKNGTDEACKIIKRNAAKARRLLPGRITDTSVWRSRNWLRAYQYEYRSKSREWTGAGWVAGIAGVIASPFTGGVRAGLATSAAGFAAGEGISSRSGNFSARVDALQDRIDELDSGC